MSTTEKIARNSIFLIAAPLFLNFLSIFATAYIARKLGATDFGLFNFAIAFSSVFLPVARFGLNNMTIRDSARKPDNINSYLGDVFILRGALMLSTTAGIIVVIKMLGYDPRTDHMLYLSILLFVFITLNGLFSEIFMGFQRMGYASNITLVSGLILTGLSVCILYFGYGLDGLIWTYILGHITGFLYGIYIQATKFPSPRFVLNRVFMRSYLVQGVPFFAMGFIYMGLTQFSVIMLSKMADLASVGIYTAAVALVVKLILIPQSIGQSLYPAVAALYKDSKMHEAAETVQKYFMLSLVVGLPVAIGVTIIGDDIIKLIYGNEYIKAAPLLKISIWTFPVWCFSQIEFHALLAAFKQRDILNSYIISLAIHVILNLVLIPKYKLMGAAISFFIGFFILFVLMTYFARKYMLIRFLYNGKSARIVGINIILAALLFVLYTPNVFIMVAMASFFYGAALLLTRTISVGVLVRTA